VLVIQIDGTVFEHSRVARRVLKAAGIWIEPCFYEEVRDMTNQNVTGKEIKAQDKPLGESALKAPKPSDVPRELTDDEIAAVAGGLAVGHGGKMNPP
jgi:hypothetical protein